MRKTLFWYFCANSGLKRPQNEFYQVLPKINAPNFSDFYMKLEWHDDLKVS